MSQPQPQRPNKTGLRRYAHEVMASLRVQTHDDEKVRAKWRRATPEDQAVAYADVKDMLERSTGSINNSYLKVQISTGLVIGLIALFLSVFRQMRHVNGFLLVTGVLLNCLAIGISMLVTTPRNSLWRQIVKEPGVYALEWDACERYVQLSRRAFYNRVVLLRNRRIAWLATWVLTLPGFLLAVMAWAFWAALLALAIIIAGVAAYRRFIMKGAPFYPSNQYPSA